MLANLGKIISEAYFETDAALNSNGLDSKRVPCSLFYGFAITTIITQNPVAGFTVGIMCATASAVSVFVRKLLSKVDSTSDHAFLAQVSTNIAAAFGAFYFLSGNLFGLSRIGSVFAIFLLFQMYPKDG